MSSLLSANSLLSSVNRAGLMLGGSPLHRRSRWWQPLITCAAAIVLLVPGVEANEWATVAGLFNDRCVMCHSGETAPLGLDLTRYDTVMKGSSRGPIVLTEDPAASPLLQRLTGAAQPQMPLAGAPLAEIDIAKVTAWIAGGAPGPKISEPETPTPPDDPYADGLITYNEVAPVLGRHCALCHSDGGQYSSPPEGLRLTDYAKVTFGGERLVVIPGNAQASELWRRVRGLARPRMPYNGPPWLSDIEMALLADWINGGARNAEGTPMTMPVGRRVRLRGRLTGPDEVDGAAFVVTGATRRDDLPRIGGDIEVRGYIDDSGRIIADRLRGR